MGLMTSEESVLFFKTTASAETYVDLSSAMTAANRKQYHQFTRKGVPLCYDVTIEQIGQSSVGNITLVATAQSNWTVRNACVKSSAAWKKQLKDAGISLRDLSKYGRRLRIPFDAGMSAAGNGSMYDMLVPLGFDTDNTYVELFETYTAPDGTNGSYTDANSFTRFTIPDEDGDDSVEMNIKLYGESDAVASNAYFGILDEYLGSRGGVIDQPASGDQTPDADNLLQRMFSSATPSTDEIIESVEDYGEYRPYPDGELDATATPPTVSNLSETALFAGHLMAPTIGGSEAGTAAAPTVLTCRCPLGLIKFSGNGNKDSFKITVHAIYEM